MIRVRSAVGQRVFFGLTDLNMARLQAGDPIRIDRDAMRVLAVSSSDEIIIFHATRESCLELARAVGMDEKVFLDALGEG